MTVSYTHLLTGCGGKSGKDNKDMKDLVYKSEKLSCTDDMKGDISNFTVAGDKIYVYTTEWVPGPGNTEDAEAEEEAYEAKDQEETAEMCIRDRFMTMERAVSVRLSVTGLGQAMPVWQILTVILLFRATPIFMIRTGLPEEMS